MASTETWDGTRKDRKRSANVSRKKWAAQKLAKAKEANCLTSLTSK